MVPPPSRYASDTYFIETRDVLAELKINPDTFSRANALLLLKPDAAVTGGMGTAVEWLLEHRYRIVGAHPVQLSPLQVRTLWYFNWHRATPERRRLADRLTRISPSVVLIVTHPDDSQPVSVRLTTEKGPADPAQREPGQLRHALAAGTYLLNQVHSPDGPDDVLRELSVYFDEAQLVDVIAACVRGADVSAEAIRMVQRIESGVDRRSAALEVAQDVVWANLRASGMAERPQTGREWVAALDEAKKRQAALDPWSCIVLESAYLPMHRRTE